MAYPFDIKSYVQGYRFSDDSNFYDANRQRFRDLAGYGDRAALTINVGAPVFNTVAGRRALKLDNTFHGNMPMPIPWMGSMIVVIKPAYAGTGTSISRYPLLFGDSASISSNGQLRVGYFSGSRSISAATGSAQLVASQSRADNNTVVAAFAFDQQTRTAYSTTDGMTVTETVAPVSTISGGAVALGCGQYGARFGNMSSVAGDTVEDTDLPCYLFEMHFFAEPILQTDLAEAKEIIDTLRAQYGVV